MHCQFKNCFPLTAKEKLHFSLSVVLLSERGLSLESCLEICKLLSILACSSFFVVCSSSNKVNSISCGIYLSFKSRDLELFCKISIHLSFKGIFLGL